MSAGNEACFKILKKRFPKIKKHSNASIRSYSSRVETLLFLKRENRLGIFRAETRKIIERHNVMNELKLPNQKGIPVKAREKIRLRQSGLSNLRKPFLIPVGKDKKHVALVVRSPTENKRVKNTNSMGLYGLLSTKMYQIESAIQSKIDKLKISL